MRVRNCAPDLAIFVEAIFAKTFIGLLIVVREIQVVFDQWCPGIGVVADAIPADPRIQQGKAQNKKDKQDPLKASLLNLDLRIQGKSILRGTTHS